MALPTCVAYQAIPAVVANTANAVAAAYAAGEAMTSGTSAAATPADMIVIRAIDELSRELYRVNNSEAAEPAASVMSVVTPIRFGVQCCSRSRGTV